MWEAWQQWTRTGNFWLLHISFSLASADEWGNAIPASFTVGCLGFCLEWVEDIGPELNIKP